MTTLNSENGARPSEGLRKARVLTLTAVIMSGIVLTACGNGESNEVGDDDVVSLSIGTMPLADLAPFYLAVEEGMFEDADVEVDIVSSSAGAAQIASVMSGDLDLTYSNFVSVLQGVEQGLPLVAIRENNRSGPQGIYAADDSGITAPDDLSGRTIAINSLGNIQELTANAVLETYDVAPEDVQFVEMPPSDMESALEAGHVDAVWLVEPFLTSAESGDTATRIVDAFEGPTADIPVAGWTTTQDFLDENQDAVDRFIAVMDEAMELAESNPDLIADVIPTYTEIPEDVAAELSDPSLTPTSDLATLSDLEVLMVQYGILQSDLDIEELIYQP